MNLSLRIFVNPGPGMTWRSIAAELKEMRLTWGEAVNICQGQTILEVAFGGENRCGYMDRSVVSTFSHPVLAVLT